MGTLADIGTWITENESLLSGLAALVVLLGVILSPAGRAIGLWRGRRQENHQPVADLPTSPSINPAQPQTALPSAEPLIGVLAFDNLSNESDLQFFSDGVSEDILQNLSRISGLKVISRASSFQFRGEKKAEAASRLGCTHLLDGTIRRGAGQVRISAHLVETSTGVTLWSDRFDRQIEDVLAVQDEIAAHIATHLSRAFNPASIPARRQGSLPSPAIYDRFLTTSVKSYAPSELGEQVSTLEKVTAEAPDFAAAWGRLAYLRSFLHFHQPFSIRPMIRRQVESEATTALALDPLNADAAAARLFVLPPFGAFDHTAERLAELRRLPRAGDSGRFIGWFLRVFGRVRESLVESEAAYRLDVLDPMSANLVALARLAAGKPELAVPVFEDLIKRNPEMSFPYSSLLRAHALLGNWPAVDALLAAAESRQLREFEEGLDFIRAKRYGDDASISRWLNRVIDRADRSRSLDLSALVYTAHLGRIEDAYRLIGTWRPGPTGSAEDVMGPDAYRPSIMFQANLPELRNDPRFPALCARLGLAAYWSASGNWPDCADEVPYDFRAACRTAETPAQVWVYPA